MYMITVKKGFEAMNFDFDYMDDASRLVELLLKHHVDDESESRMTVEISLSTLNMEEEE